VDGRRRAAVATFFADAPLTAGSTVELPDDALQHIRARRLHAEDTVRLTNGRGTTGEGTLAGLTRDSATVLLERTTESPRPALLRLFVPVADRERMLWLAEKAAEVGVTAWQPVIFRRSASVSPRGEGERFLEKARARMIGALEQSGGAWLPEISREIQLADALVRPNGADGGRFLLERGGAPLLLQRPRAADVMVGPEGGIEDDERAHIVERHDWLPVSLGDTTLRFETAGVLAAGMLRALLTMA
jgi:16S rRNA (uracil1498-N3)-methyltransferase